jgi:glutaminyl-tRNA synthetase
VDSDGDRPMLDRLNPDSWKETNGFVEPSLVNAFPGEKYQFVRNGYFAVDNDSARNALIFNRTVELKSSYK